MVGAGSSRREAHQRYLEPSIAEDRHLSLRSGSHACLFPGGRQTGHRRGGFDFDVLLRGGQNLLHGREAGEDFSRSVVPQGVHAHVLRDALDRLRVGLSKDEGPDRVVDQQKAGEIPRRPVKPVLVHCAQPRALWKLGVWLVSKVSRPIAFADVPRKVAGRRVVSAGSPEAHSLGRQPELLELELFGRIRVLAVRTEHPHQTLRENADDARAEEERLRAHVDRPGDRASGVVRVDRREHEVPGERRVDGDFQRFRVADLADHDDVRILPEKR